MADPWLPVATKGCFSLVVMTRAKLVQDRAEIVLHPDCQVLGIIMPDDEGEWAPVSFLTLDTLAAFVAEMQPRRVRVACAPAEDAEKLLALIERRAMVH